MENCKNLNNHVTNENKHEKDANIWKYPNNQHKNRHNQKNQVDNFQEMEIFMVNMKIIRKYANN